VASTCGAHVHIESPLQPHDKGFTSFIHTLTAMVLLGRRRTGLELLL
jgi:hypothetical protein